MLLGGANALEFRQGGYIDDRALQLAVGQGREQVGATGENSSVRVSQSCQCLVKCARSQKQRDQLLRRPARPRPVKCTREERSSSTTARRFCEADWMMNGSPWRMRIYSMLIRNGDQRTTPCQWHRRLPVFRFPALPDRAIL